MNKKPAVEYLYRIGEVFGRLTLTGYSYREGKNGYVRRFVEAGCQCGDISIYVLDNLTSGSTRSCGCLKLELCRSQKYRRTHGLRGHQLYAVREGIKGRCYDKSNISYPYYGAKGVKMCDEWKTDFKKFFDWCMAAGWKPGLTVDRFPDKKGNYEPGNCRLASQRAQRLNRDDLRLITAFGETKCVADWVLDERCKVSYKCLHLRVTKFKDSWPDIEKAFTVPPQQGRKVNKYKPENMMLTAFGETKSMAEWLKDERCVANAFVLRNRIKCPQRWTAEAAITTRVRKTRIKEAA